MAKTARQLIRELGYRLGELAVFSATSTGTTTTVLSTTLQNTLPGTITGYHPWLYPITGTAGNLGAERRVLSWSYDQATLTLATALPSATATSDEFELHMRTQRARKLEAINSAVGQLGLLWYRQFVDTSLTTAQNDWDYTVPANVARVSKVEIQVATEASLVAGGYPYDDATPLNWTVRRSVATNGTETQVLQFGVQPPPGRTLRLHCEGWFADLAADTDTLALAGVWERPAFDWIMAWGKHQILDEVTERQPGGESEKYRIRSIDQLEKSRDRILQMLQAHQNGRIVVPGVGTGQRTHATRSSRDYFGALSNPH